MIPLDPTYEEVNALFHFHNPPAGFVAHLVDYNDGEYYAVRMYREQFDKLTVLERWAVMDWANQTIGLMNNLVPTVAEVWRRPGSE